VRVLTQRLLASQKAPFSNNQQKSPTRLIPFCCLPKVARSRPCSHPTTAPSKNMILESFCKSCSFKSPTQQLPLSNNKTLSNLRLLKENFDRTHRFCCLAQGVPVLVPQPDADDPLKLVHVDHRPLQALQLPLHHPDGVPGHKVHLLLADGRVGQGCRGGKKDFVLFQKCIWDGWL
jgi:hypothetical protein